MPKIWKVNFYNLQVYIRFQRHFHLFHLSRKIKTMFLFRVIVSFRVSWAKEMVYGFSDIFAVYFILFYLSNAFFYHYSHLKRTQYYYLHRRVKYKIQLLSFKYSHFQSAFHSSHSAIYIWSFWKKLVSGWQHDAKM